jgi:hypothetical protein
MEKKLDMEVAAKKITPKPKTKTKKAKARKPNALKTKAAKTKNPKNKTFSSEKTTHTSKKPNRTSDAKSSPNAWGANMFDPSMTNNFKEGMQNFMNNANNSFCGINPKNSQGMNVAQDMIAKLSHNMRHNFEQNMELGQEALKCKTASDFIEFQRKNFETNYKNSVKTYSEFLHDVQNLATQTIKETTNYGKQK